MSVTQAISLLGSSRGISGSTPGLSDYRLRRLSGYALEGSTRTWGKGTAAVLIGRLAQMPYYSDRERAALAWTEAGTLITNDHVPDKAREQKAGA